MWQEFWSGFDLVGKTVLTCFMLFSVLAPLALLVDRIAFIVGDKDRERLKELGVKADKLKNEYEVHIRELEAELATLKGE